DGTVTPCIFNRRDILGNIFKRSLLDIASNAGSGFSPEKNAPKMCENELQCVSCQLTAFALRRGLT
ncbi:SPASM domain-containing protein, partial [Myxococcota bacterium]|nr:SPASM domain-containing protein [Myxococcota bacterium]